MSRLLRGIVSTTAGGGVALAAGLAAAPLLAQALGPGGRGELAAATAPLMLATGALTLGLPEAVTHFTARRSGIGRRAALAIFWILLAAGLAGTAAILVLAPALSAGDPGLALLVSLAGAAVAPSLSVGLLRGVAAGRHRWRLVGLEKASGALLRLGAIAALAAGGELTPLSATVVFAASPLAGGLVYLGLLGRSPARHTHPGPAASADLARYASALWPGLVVGIALSRADQLLIVPLSDTEQLGIYAVAVTIADAALVLNAAVRDVVFAAESARNDDARLQRAARLSTAATLLGAVALLAASAWSVPFLFGPGFAPAVPVTALLLLGVVLGNPGSVAGAGLNARGRPGLRSLSLVLALAANLVLLLLLVPALGAVGAALAKVAGNIVAGNTNLLWLRLFHGQRIRDYVGLRRGDLRTDVAAAAPRANVGAGGA
ncbi:MAG: oligosaccharide flippase family protein [Arthrobacter sp.]|uniref:lipopolysaccharide biosynthesis protein n=1 Tax=Arthrobacter sp. TaxID=1667 RepID=UPI00349B1C61